MTSYTVFQLREDIDHETRLRITCDYHEEDRWLENVKAAIENNLYVPVATIATTCLEGVSFIGNNVMGECEKYIVRSPEQRMHSVSIGDVIVSDTVNVVAMFGFEEL